VIDARNWSKEDVKKVTSGTEGLLTEEARKLLTRIDVPGVYTTPDGPLIVTHGVTVTGFSHEADLRVAEGKGHIEWGDIAQLFKGAWNVVAPWIGRPQSDIDPYHAGAAQVGKEVTEGLAFEVATAGLGNLASWAKQEGNVASFLADERGALRIPGSRGATRSPAYLREERKLQGAVDQLQFERVTSQRELRALTRGEAALRAAEKQGASFQQAASEAGSVVHERMGAAGSGGGIDYRGQGELKTHWTGDVSRQQLRSGLGQAQAANVSQILHYLYDPKSKGYFKFLVDSRNKELMRFLR
jgi:hypothetical protein